MDLKEITPLVIYDNECYLCVQFAKFVNFLAKGRLHFVGHYTDLGKKIREGVLDSNALQMFWFIDDNTAYGGRAALGPLFSAILNADGKNIQKKAFSLTALGDILCVDQSGNEHHSFPIHHFLEVLLRSWVCVLVG